MAGKPKKLKGCDNYFFDYRDKHTGKKKWFATKTNDYAQALKTKREFEYKQYCKTQKIPNDKILWKDFCEEFKQYSRQHKDSPESDEYSIRMFDARIPITYVSEITTKKFRDYIDKRLEEGIKKNSINRELSTFRSMFTWALSQPEDERKFFKDHPVRPIKKFRTPIRVKYRILTPDEIQTIKDMKKTKISRKLMLGMLYTGLRLKDMVYFKWKQIDWEKELIDITPSKTRNTDPDKSYVPLNSKFKALLLEIKEEKIKSEYVFAYPDGSLINNNTASTLIIKEMKAAGLKGVSAHICRHTFISYLFMKGIDSTLIMEWARISDTKTLRAYRHLSPNFETGKINQLPY